MELHEYSPTDFGFCARSRFRLEVDGRLSPYAPSFKDIADFLDAYELDRKTMWLALHGHPVSLDPGLFMRPARKRR